ncbi:MAG TPA: TetR/AcrR family transcriptional regulator [Steroidobacteraceae bacterium]|nr:TetR/AcrR family transcriptional regulator [Steroidobacteraceae bacterium]
MTARRARQPARRNDPEGLRRRILDAAFSMFQSRGYNGTSMQDLMKAIEVTGGALHHHFPTKSSLALAVFAERVAPAVRETWIRPVQSATSFGNGVQAVFEDIVSSIDARGSTSGCPLNNLAMELSLTDPEFRQAANGIFREWQDALGESLRTTRAGSKMSKAARKDIAGFIVASYSGAMSLAKAEQSTSALRNAATVLKRWLQSHDLDR